VTIAKKVFFGTNAGEKRTKIRVAQSKRIDGQKKGDYS